MRTQLLLSNKVILILSILFLQWSFHLQCGDCSLQELWDGRFSDSAEGVPLTVIRYLYFVIETELKV